MTGRESFDELRMFLLSRVPSFGGCFVLLISVCVLCVSNFGKKGMCVSASKYSPIACLGYFKCEKTATLAARKKEYQG